MESLIKTESHLLKKGKSAYMNLSENQIDILKSIKATPVQRNSGIDGFLDEFVMIDQFLSKFKKKTKL